MKPLVWEMTRNVADTQALMQKCFAVMKDTEARLENMNVQVSKSVAWCQDTQADTRQVKRDVEQLKNAISSGIDSGNRETADLSRQIGQVIRMLGEIRNGR